MSAIAALFIIVLAFVTATLSGVFGMAGGLVLMGGLALVLPVSAAFVTHGLLQLVANGWRAILHRQHVNWRIVALYALGSLIAGTAMSLIALAPSKPGLFLFMGLLPALLWLPQDWIKLDAAKPAQALLSGIMVTGVNLTAGVAGPLLMPGFTDSIFLREKGTKAYGFAPFIVNADEINTMHGDAERISKKNVTRGLETLLKVVVDVSAK